MSIEIRILRRGDEAILEHVADDVFDDPIVSGAAREFLADPRHHLAVALHHGEVVGFASGVHYVHPDKPHPEFWINEIGVAATHQNRGIGKSLMRSLFDVARMLNCHEAWVLTKRENGPAMRLYRSLDGAEAPEETVMFSFRL